jgi:hypothetical protein
MPQRESETRTITPFDIPLVRRLTEKGMMLDTELLCTRSSYRHNGALLSSILLPQRGLHTLVARADGHQVVGQFRLKPDDHYARMVFIAPHLGPDEAAADTIADDTAYLHVLDAMAREAGRYNAHALMAEVDEDSQLFETMRAAGFAVYARQQIWVRPPADLEWEGATLELSEQTEMDAPGVQSLYALTVPSLMQPMMPLPGETRGLIYRRRSPTGDRIAACVTLTEGKYGIYLIPHLHTDVMSEARLILEAAVRRLPRANRVPVYVCVRRYQDWISSALGQLGFEPGAQQAVMVRHLTAGIRQTKFAPVQAGLAVPVKPPTRPLSQNIMSLSAGAAETTLNLDRWRAQPLRAAVNRTQIAAISQITAL